MANKPWVATADKRYFASLRMLDTAGATTHG
jgi:hypothetical protein